MAAGGGHVVRANHMNDESLRHERRDEPAGLKEGRIAHRRRVKDEPHDRVCRVLEVRAQWPGRDAVALDLAEVPGPRPCELFYVDAVARDRDLWQNRTAGCRRAPDSAPSASSSPSTPSSSLARGSSARRTLLALAAPLLRVRERPTAQCRLRECALWPPPPAARRGCGASRECRVPVIP
jgi:hypothetical protein